MNNNDKIQKLSDLRDNEEWNKAIKLAKSLLKHSPKNHWLLTNISSSYYEARQYATALRYAEKALKIAPACPLVLWDYAGSLDMLEREREAIRIWEKLLNRSIKSMAFGLCGEGMKWTESLLNDCRYSIGNSYANLGKKKLAIKYLKAHLEFRRPGLTSLYTQKEIKKELSALLE